MLFGKRRAYQRKVSVADLDGVCSGDIYVFEPKDPGVLLPELLPFICQTDAFFDHAVGTSAGSLSPRTNWKSLALYEFALPPLEEQQGRVLLFNATRMVLEQIEQAIEKNRFARRSLLIDTFRPERGTMDGFPPHWQLLKMEEAGDVQLGQQRHPKFREGARSSEGRSGVVAFRRH